MITLNLSLKVILTFVTAATATELIPERFLRPRDFNHHPFTDVGIPASLKPAPRLPQTHPYAILSKKKPREGRQFPHQDEIYYPIPHPSVLPKKHLETNEVDGYDDPYVHIPKNYAFSYSVKDHHSGDDFSHSQAHNGKATRGQYRVKLPDGRTQIVSYTADHKGYRADVQYEDDTTSSKTVKPIYEQNIPETPAALPHHVPNTLQEHRPSPSGFPQISEEAPSAPVQYRFVPRYNIEPSNYVTPQSEQYVSSTPNYVSSTAIPIGYLIDQPTPSTPSPQYEDSIYAQEKYVSSTTPAPYVKENYVSSTPQFGDRYVSTTAAPARYVERQYIGAQDYGLSSPSPTPQQVLVTPRTHFNLRPQTSELKQRPHILYRFVGH